MAQDKYIKKQGRKKYIHIRVISLFTALFLISFCISYFIGGKNDNSTVLANNEKVDEHIEESKAEDTNNLEQNNTTITKEPEVITKPAVDNTVFKDSKGNYIIKNPDDLLVLVNKERYLPSTWKPKDLITPKINFAFSGWSSKKQMRKAAGKALEELFKAAKKENISILATSGYRSFETQKQIFNENAQAYGKDNANQTSAIPGQSEHQTGLAMDITSAKVNYELEESFANTVEGKWLKENASAYGFIIRYPKGKEAITGYNYEPWHIRYVGKDVAKYITENNMTLEEYTFSVMNNGNNK
jgi:D-alanyl-D-alanine carboxypeptidase